MQVDGDGVQCEGYLLRSALGINTCRRKATQAGVGRMRSQVVMLVPIIALAKPTWSYRTRMTLQNCADLDWDGQTLIFLHSALDVSHLGKANDLEQGSSLQSWQSLKGLSAESYLSTGLPAGETIMTSWRGTWAAFNIIHHRDLTNIWSGDKMR